MGRSVRNRLQSLFGRGDGAVETYSTNSYVSPSKSTNNSSRSFASSLVGHFRSHHQPIQKPPITSAAPGYFKSLFRDHPVSFSSAGTAAHCAPAFDQEPPYGSYDSYNSETRLLLDTGSAHILKTFFSDSVVPLEDEGVGRLKAVYEVWMPKNGLVSKDKISGIYTLSLVCANRIEGTLYCDGETKERSLQKHHVQCIYAGTGVRRGCCNAESTNTATTGIEVWIKGSLPVSGPWVQSMNIPPEHRLNKLCPIAAPKHDFSTFVNAGCNLVELPTLTAGSDSSVFELDSDVYIYYCRLTPCASICYTAKPAARRAREPPIFEITRLRRATTISMVSPNHTLSSSSPAPPGSRGESHSLKLCKTRSLYIHLCTTYDKHGIVSRGGGCLMLPGSIQLNDGDGIHLKEVAPGADIPIKNIGFDRAQFLLIDMPGYKDNSDAKSI
ncbi:hypothetical protein GGI25_000433 [Coemansia spiralis]|uniref:Uncharacterized protein n=2 Tax=Coemansia TaxID=4863 RepID=A0A9W8GEW9_9FUNG|nr:hypothetical protein BX070DRAFT_250937 [Coemansia spiralis]KAJ1996370.1 hypothetical protein EDC05_000260 [Coemansia umbellata]KAJ2624166.1 hypothetical protein GGI26_001742 [Coemansia sp. RSA 1358]KAJ2680798.1 hypothetical protein GGI25_000433 [Coemansia spiralis]